MTPDGIRTHEGLDRTLCGTPGRIEPDRAGVEMLTVPSMAADSRGLVHGGFVFGLADHAAMLAVNDPNVVLGAADVRFLAPVRVGDRLEAEAVSEGTGRKRTVAVVVRRGEITVMEGRFTCFVLEKHVLDVPRP